MFTARIMSTITAGWTVFSVDALSTENESTTVLIDLCIVVTNILLIVVTGWLIRVTVRDAHDTAVQAMANEQQTTRMLVRVIRGLTRRSPSKHRKPGRVEVGED